KRTRPHFFRDLPIKFPPLGYAAANHDDIRIENVDHLRQSARQAIFKSMYGCRRLKLTSFEFRDNVLRGPRSTGYSSIVQCDPGPRNPHLHTSLLTAVARRSRILLRSLPRQRIVPPFARE